MASVLWIGETLRHSSELLRPLLLLPVQEIVLPWAEDTAERLYEPDFKGEVAALTGAGEKHFWHLPLLTADEWQSALCRHDHYFLQWQDFATLEPFLPQAKGKLLALGEIKPPIPIAFRETKPRQLYAALCKALPSLEPNTFYITGGSVRCSIEDEDFAAVLERMRGQ